MSDMRSWDGLRETLEARREAVNKEIGAYPGPITGCDAQFNHLLVERQQLNRELGRLNDEMARDNSPPAIAAFIKSCPFLAGAGGGKLI